MQHSEGVFKVTPAVELYEQWWRPDGMAKAVLAIVHGIGEHSGRYKNVVDAFVPKGYAVCGFDLRGHGRSGGIRGYVNRWSEMIDDVGAFLARVFPRFPGVPNFLYGHSLGGLIALEYALRFPQGLRGVIASAPSLDTSGISAVKMAMARVMSRVMPKLSMATGLDASAISRDPAVVEAYKCDPLVHDRGTPRMATESVAAMKWTNAHAKDWSLPLLVVQGSADRLVSPARVKAFFEAVPVADKRLQWYEGGFHESHNDVSRVVVFTEMEKWIAEHL